MQPDVALKHFLERVTRRWRLVAILDAAALGVAIAVLITLAGWWRGWSVMPVTGACVLVIAAAAAIAWTRVRPSFVDVASRVEQARPHRNLIVTATEIMGEHEASRPYVLDRVMEQAAAAVQALDARVVIPATRNTGRLASIAALWVVTLTLFIIRPAAVPLSSIVAAAAPSARIGALDITVVPPAYMRRSALHLHDPDRIDAPEGSSVQVRITTGADRADIETIDGRRALSKAGHNVFSGAVQLSSDGYIAIDAFDANGNPSDRRMIGVGVSPDRPPVVKITTPGRDLHLSDSAKTIAIQLEAEDDIGLASLILRYTRVSGSGEQYSFSEGAIPLDITRTNTRTWKARGDLKLAALAMNKGDMVVYRASASDNRPGAAATLSDAFIVEIIAPGNEAMAGFAAEDETDKYALSQEMVIQKTEKLIKRAPSMNADSVKAEAMLLAAEQRSVRAEFVFMMGGELAEDVLDAADATELHEEAEAAGETDIAAGRGANKSRLALVDAIRGMSQANTALTAFDLNKALDAERRALKSLQAAFSHTRYILRGLTQHERLDLARRLTGDLSAAQGDAKAAVVATDAPRTIALRTALSTAAEISGKRLDANSSKRMAMLSVTVVRIDPGNRSMAQAASRLNDAATAVMRNQVEVARTKLDEAASIIANALRDAAVRTPAAQLPSGLNTLNGALIDAIRANGAVKR